MNERPMLVFYKPYDEKTGKYMAAKGETNLYSSLQWENGFDYAGSIEIHMPFSKKGYDLVAPFTVIKIERDIRENMGIVIWRGVSVDSKGHKILTVKAKTLSYILTFRGIRSEGFSDYMTLRRDSLLDIIEALLHINTNAEDLTLLGTAICLKNENKIEDIDLGYGYTLPSPGQNLYNEIANLCKANETGFYIKRERKQTWLIPCSKKVNDDIEFSLSAKNIISMNISSGIDNYTSGFFYGTGYKLNCGGVTSTDKDIYRIEKYVEVPDKVLENSEAGGYGAANHYCRNQIISKYPMTNEISADVTQSDKRYLVDYSVGDVVAVCCEELGIRAQYPINAVREIWEDNYKAEVIFGERMLTVWQKAELRYKGGF